MAHTEYKPLRWLLVFPAVFSMVLISMEPQAQDEDETCPCFRYAAAASVFLAGEQVAAAGGVVACSAEDYDVEISAEVVVWDQDYATIAQVSVKWYDFDPSRCEYIDTVGNAGVERNVSWPHPASEVTARACFDIITSVIAKSDTAGNCVTYP